MHVRLMKFLVSLFLAGSAFAQILSEYREDYGLNRHEVRAQQAKLDTAALLGRLGLKAPGDQPDQARLDSVLQADDPIPIEWLLCENRFAVDSLLALPSLTPVQYQALCQAFLDASPARLPAGGAEESYIFGDPPRRLAQKVGEVVGFDPPKQGSLWTRDEARRWMRRVWEALRDEVAPSTPGQRDALAAAVSAP